MKKEKIIIGMLIFVISIVSILLCVNIFNPEHKDNVIFVLFGNDQEEIYINNEYYDLGFIAKLDDGTDISDYVSVENNLDNQKVGEYSIKYNLNYQGVKKQLRRKIIVINDPLNEITLKLNGSNVIYLLKGMEYQELGVISVDKIDGDISSSLKINNNVNVNIKGEYIINYEVSNSRNIRKSIERKVIVYDYDYKLDMKVVDNSVQLFFNTNSDLYSYLLINEEKISNNSIKKNLLNNSEYYIYIKDIYGNTKKEFYDFKKATFTCNASINDSQVTIKVDNLNKEVLEYNFFVNNVKYTSKVSNYTLGQNISNDIKVSVLDKNNNLSDKVSCSVNDYSKTYESGLKQIKSNYPAYLYVPENVKSYNKKTLVVFLHGGDERGNDFSLLERYGFIKYIKAGRDYDYFILTPQLYKDGSWMMNGVINMINEVKKDYPIDEERIHIAGFSMGAIGIMGGMSGYQDYFASALLIAPGNRGIEDAKYFRNIKTRVYNGTYDSFSYTDKTKAFVDELKRLGGDVSYISYEGLGHNIVDNVLLDESVLNWMISNKKGS